jgi:hypothetical protein
MLIFSTADAAVVPANNDALPPAVPAMLWRFDGADALGTWTRTAAGPRPPLHPLFTAGNLAAEFTSPADQVIVPHAKAPSFKHGEALTFEFWIAPGDLKEKQPVFLLAKGDPTRAGQSEDNLNYGLTVERLTAGTMRVGFCFAAEPEKDGAVPSRHQWWSGAISLVGLDWHHVVVNYTFGDPTSILLHVNGRMQLFSGSWQKSTERGPVQREGDLRLGGGSETAFFRGRLDSLILHRGVLRTAEIAPLYALQPPLPAVARDVLEPGKIRVEICTQGVPGRLEWPDTAPPAGEIMTEDVFGFFSLPHVYVATGVRGDPPRPTLLRASALVTLPPGKHRLLLRARGISRLIIDGKQILDTPLMPSDLNGHHLTTDQDNYLKLGPDFRFAPPGNREAWCEFESSGQPHLVVLETVFGRPRPGLGETVVAWSREGEAGWQLLSPSGRKVPYTDQGWAAYETERSHNLDRINTERRLARRAGQASYWAKRREAAQAWLAATAEIPVPALPPQMPALNDIDHFIGARIAEVAPAYEKREKSGPDFFRDIQPILESRCYDCHQGSKAKAGLRLDKRAGALHGGESDGPAVTPFKPAASALLRRIRATDENDVMPPKGDPLPPKEIALLEKWIEQGANWPELKVSTLKLPPLADDLSFLRRVSLDTVGVPPSEEEIRRFLADSPKERRGRAIDRLLADPRWADHWMGYWQDVLAENPNLLTGSLNNTGPFRWWIYEALLDDQPMDAFVTELVRMEGSQNNGGPAGFGIAGQNDAPLAEKGAILASAFLGVEMKCARCHDAPAHESKQQQLFELAALLNKAPVKVPATSSVPVDKLHSGGRKALIQVTLKPNTDVQPVWPFPQFVDAATAARLAADPASTRDQLAAFITAPQNERFPQVMVNRIWQKLMGRGLVSNPGDWEKSESTHPALLQWLAREFVRSGYSMKAIAKLIMTSHAYQRASLPELEQTEPLFVARAPLRMSAEQVVDSLFASTGKPFDLEEVSFDIDGLAGGKPTLGKPRRAWMLTSTSNERDRPSLTLPRIQAVLTTLEAFGWRAARQSPVTLREDNPNVLQPALLANGTMTGWAFRLSDDHGVTQLALQEQSLESFITTLYLRLLTRKPGDAEMAAATELLGPGFARRRVTPPAAAPTDRVRPKFVTWSNHLDGPANALAHELEANARRGDPPTARLDPDWRERLEDFLWQTVTRPEWLFIR